MEVGYRFGSYTLIRPIGEGGQGRTWVAHDDETGRPKCLKFGHAGQTDVIQGEFDRLRAIRDPRIARVYDQGFAPDNTPFFAADFFPGCTLRDLFAVATEIPEHVAVGVALELARALTAGHAVGISHHDLKPANIILTPEGAVRLVDYGCARLLSSRKSIGHTPGYYAPEQLIAPEEAGPGADWFSLGVVLFEMFTGRRPFGASAPRAYIDAVAARRRPKLPPGQEVLVAPLLQPDRDPDLGIETVVRLNLVAGRQGEWRSGLAALVARVTRPKPLSVRRLGWRKRAAGAFAVCVVGLSVLAGLAGLAHDPPRSSPQIMSDAPDLTESGGPGAPPTEATTRSKRVVAPPHPEETENEAASEEDPEPDSERIRARSRTPNSGARPSTPQPESPEEAAARHRRMQVLLGFPPVDPAAPRGDDDPATGVR